MKSRFLVLFILASFSLAAQDFTTSHSRLVTLMNQVSEAPDSVQKAACMADFATLFEATLRQKGSMDFAFDSIPYVGKLVSKDKKVRVFTWNLPLSNERHAYFGIVQYRFGKEEKTMVLTDKKRSIQQPATAVLEYGDWFGALYYQLLQNKSGKQVYYTLLGFDFYGDGAHRKIIDALTFDESGSPVFGTPLFDNGKRKVNRVLLEYSATTPFFLNYLPSKKMIVYQQLEMTQDSATGAPARVPTGVFEGLQFKDGRWMLQKEVDVRMKDFK